MSVNRDQVKVGDTLIFNNWLGGQFAKVQVLEVKSNGIVVLFPPPKDEAAFLTNGSENEPEEFDFDSLDREPETGFTEWTGYGVFAV